MKRSLRFGVIVPNGFRRELPLSQAPGEQYGLMTTITKEAESLGFYSAWFYDHFIPFPRITTDSCFESWTTLASLAASTSRIRLGTLVTCAGFREPGVLAKMAATVDRVSGGRLELGVGAGWYKAEYDMYGIPFEGNAVRIRRLSETVQVVKKLWTEEEAHFRGRYYTLQGARCEPKPVQKPHPPVMIGGGGEQLTLRVVAKHADMCNLGLGVDEVEAHRKIQIIEDYCKLYQRSPCVEKTIHREVIIAADSKEAHRRAEARRPPSIPSEAYLRPRIVGDPSECVAQLNKYIELGITYFIFYVHGATEPEPLRILAREVLSTLQRRN